MEEHPCNKGMALSKGLRQYRDDGMRIVTFLGSFLQEECFVKGDSGNRSKRVGRTTPCNRSYRVGRFTALYVGGVWRDNLSLESSRLNAKD